MPARITPSAGGKPDKLIRDALMVALNRFEDDGAKKRKYLNVIASKLVEKAASGDVAAIKEVADRVDGRPAQQIDVGGHNGAPIEVKWRD